jgi:hypothetical protein
MFSRRDLLLGLAATGAVATERRVAAEAEQQVDPLLLPLYRAGAGTEQIEADIEKGEKLVQDARETQGVNRACE